MSFEGECELLAGELRQKPMGTRKHAKLQGRINSRLLAFYGEDRTFIAFSIRHGEDVLIPDICVTQAEEQQLYRDILDEPALLCVEIVSPSQRPEELFSKCEQYHEWGVAYCWVVDPISQRAWTYHAGQAAAQEVFEALTGPITLALDGLFD